MIRAELADASDTPSTNPLTLAAGGYRKARNAAKASRPARLIRPLTRSHAPTPNTTSTQKVSIT